MRLTAKVAYNTIIQTAGKIVSTLLGLVAVAVITRHLGQIGYGEYTTVITFVSFFAIIADLGLTLVTAQMASRPGADKDALIGNLLSLRLVSALLFLGAAPAAVLFFPYGPDIKAGVLIAALAFLFPALNQVFIGLFQKELRLDRVSIAEVGGRVILLAGFLVAARQNAGLAGFLWAMVASNVLNFGLLLLYARRFVRVRLRFEPAYWRRIIARSWPLAITIAFNLIYLKTDTLLLSLIERTSAIGIIAEVGLYGAAYRVIDVLITLPFMFAGIILPVMTMFWAGGDHGRFARAAQGGFDVMVALALPLVIGAQFTAREIMVLVAGPDFAASGPILQVLILAAGLIFPGTIFAHAVIALDRQKKTIPAYALTAVTAVIGYFLFIPRYSYFGAAWVTIYSELAIAAASAYIVWRASAWRPRFGLAGRALAAALIMAAVLYLFREQSLAFSLAAGAAAYGAGLYLTGGIDKNGLKRLLSS